MAYVLLVYKLMNHEHGNPHDACLLEGRYANYYKIGHNAFEFLLDFGQFYQGSAEAQLHTRIITSPIYAKGLLETLIDAISQYEQTYGAIQGG